MGFAEEIGKMAHSVSLKIILKVSYVGMENQMTSHLNWQSKWSEGPFALSFVMWNGVNIFPVNLVDLSLCYSHKKDDFLMDKYIKYYTTLEHNVYVDQLIV